MSNPRDTSGAASASGPRDTSGASGPSSASNPRDTSGAASQVYKIALYDGTTVYGLDTRPLGAFSAHLKRDGQFHCTQIEPSRHATLSNTSTALTVLNWRYVAGVTLV